MNTLISAITCYFCVRTQNCVQSYEIKLKNANDEERFWRKSEKFNEMGENGEGNDGNFGKIDQGEVMYR